jgi:hypothetical protein
MTKYFKITQRAHTQMKVFALIKDMLLKLNAHKLSKKNHKNRVYTIVMKILVKLS